MKTALFLAAATSVALVVIFGIKWLNWPKKEPQEAKFDIHPNDIGLSKEILAHYGFAIYPTKGDLYAINKQGVSLTYVEGSQWMAEVRGKRTTYHRAVYTLGDLVEFCREYNVTIKPNAPQD